MPQYRATITKGKIVRQPVCDICHKVILDEPTEVIKAYDFGDGKPVQPEAEYVHKACLDGLPGCTRR